MQEEVKATILDRCFEPQSTAKSQDFVTFAQWNMLADQLALQFPRVQDQHLDWDFRLKLYEQELSCVNADIYFLEEVDHPDEIFALLPKDEFKYHFIKKKGWHQDGVFLAYRKSRFEEKQVIKSAYKTEKCHKQNYIAVALEDKKTGLTMIAAVTHLKSKSPFRWTRVLEAKELTAVLIEFEKKYKNPPVILGTDMNDDPKSEPHLIFEDYGLRSSYETLLGKEGVTTFKARSLEGPVTSRTIDYILIKEGMSKLIPIQSYRLPTPEEMGLEKGLPSGRYPSDHLMLGVRVKQVLSHKM